MSHFLFIITIYIFFNISDLIEVDVSKDIAKPKHYIITKTKDDINIDGKANETCWQNAAFSDKFIDIEGEKLPKYDTRFKMLWNDSNLYIYAELNEPHIWATLQKHDEIVYRNNDFEVFIDPSGQAQKYGEIEINSFGTILDLMLEKPYRTGGSALIKWNIEGLNSAVDIQGTINNSNDIDTMWTVEMAIPLNTIIELQGANKRLPKEGEQWRINFSRVNWKHEIIDGKYSRKKENDKLLREYNWVWSPQKVINMHEPEKWGVLQFTEAMNYENIKFDEDIDMDVKQVAYALFRKTRFGEMKYLLDEEIGVELELNVKFKENANLKALFLKTDKGFEYKIESPFSSERYIINEEGVLR